ncbi:hypothetical protein QTN25_008353 [Entamoeba marina]
MEQKNIYVNICLIGECSVGKSTFVKREINNIFEDRLYRDSILPDFWVKPLIIDRNEVIMRLVWDPFYCFPFTNLHMLVKYIKHFIVLYDINNRKTFNIAIETIQQLNDISKGIVITLVGNKIDECNRKVTTAEGITISKQFECYNFFEISLKNGPRSDIIMELMLVALEVNTTEFQQDITQHNNQQNSRKCGIQ